MIYIGIKYAWNFEKDPENKNFSVYDQFGRPYRLISP